ncbi:hypothetical protein L2E82_03302 [Cichorium intybus]|uniref:Uncharacterized protein n=2 Tax=Cichorium intybus TaxID=13427 RepID=A0ACB8YXZ5_CICIN|nr:hypothetical protein L2E82_46801 [Cichorium intybus]KAI3790337.1 hypothetical protein L2E82_03302 [Cichorium intybus]
MTESSSSVGLSEAGLTGVNDELEEPGSIIPDSDERQPPISSELVDGIVVDIDTSDGSESDDDVIGIDGHDSDYNENVKR